MPHDIEIGASLVRCAALVLLASAAAAQCSVDEDCGLLGTCAAGACACEPGWTGPTCASLDLLPAPPDAGLRQANSSNWCLTLLRDEADPDLVHAYSADFGGCTNGLNIWLTGSRVIHATGRGGSSGPAVGPFAPAWGDGDAEVAVAAEAHNPTAIRAPDGTFLLMDCAYAHGEGRLIWPRRARPARKRRTAAAAAAAADAADAADAAAAAVGGGFRAQEGKAVLRLSACGCQYSSCTSAGA